MSFKDPTKWNNAVSLMYAFGVWTMIGSYAYYKYTGQYDEKPGEKEEEVEELESPNQVVSKTAHNKTTVIYKENFVPLTARIYTFLFRGQSLNKEPEEARDDPK
ncbi:small integral membrane protein 26-like [Genypterus blacodes]|uniref:small integral membrane protein 26-like n=1 Tax=Genypterus blacodes TaxID=154954 RepID=UPI003F769864